MVLSRISSLDLGYSTGDLSVYPSAKDTRSQLYQAANNAITTLKQTLTYNGKYIVVEDNSLFPSSGLIRIGPPPGKSGNFELVYYDQKVNGVFRNLIRGFAGSRQGQWNANSHVINAVMAEHHNALKDAIIQIETNLGTRDAPATTSLNGILKAQEVKFLSPKPIFRAHPTKGVGPLRVRFQNFSTGPLIRYLWDFGDGTTSIEKHPIHTYQTEGIYSVKLNIITSLGAQGVTTKSNYITVSDDEREAFFYASPMAGYSRETAEAMDISPTTFQLVDQTDGDISQRYWIFDGPGSSDGVEVENQSLPVLDPNIHTVNFIYDLPGEYEPSLLVLYANQSLKRAFLRDTIIVQ